MVEVKEIDYNEIRKMSVDKLLMYYNALSAISGRYEKERDRYFNSMDIKERNMWVSYNQLLSGVKPYLEIVFNALKDRTMMDLQEISDKKEEVIKPKKPKKPVVPRTKGEKK
jgi:hypothetical protein